MVNFEVLSEFQKNARLSAEVHCKENLSLLRFSCLSGTRIQGKSSTNHMGLMCTLAAKSITREYL